MSALNKPTPLVLKSKQPSCNPLEHNGLIRRKLQSLTFSSAASKAGITKQQRKPHTHGSLSVEANRRNHVLVDRCYHF
ncbi:hypothetical protein [Paenibacillus xylanexedens]|uniref:hypothetical protein n=1 Tax=Paenibacillus xylanexedens TaxID=528191 RepID=UPI001642596E|nr:hypothetical protein [Paenibacillus xylanexedens]